MRLPDGHSGDRITLDKIIFQLSGGLRLIAQKIPSGLTTGSFPAECFLSLDKRTQIKKFDKNNQVKKSRYYHLRMNNTFF